MEFLSTWSANGDRRIVGKTRLNFVGDGVGETMR